MSALLNHYYRGYFITSIISSSQQAGLFQILDKTTYKGWKQILKKSGINAGYLSLVLQILKLAGVVSHKGDSYKLTADIDSFLNQDLMYLYQNDPEQLIHHPEGRGAFSSALTRIFFNRESSNRPCDSLLEGAVVVPLLVSLKELDIDNLFSAIDAIDKSFSQKIRQFFSKKKWVNDRELNLPDSGAQFFQQYFLKKISSHTSLLHKVRDFLVGDIEERSSAIEEWMKIELASIIDISSQDNCLKDLEKEIASNDQAHSNQSEKIIAVNGTAESIYSAIRDKSLNNLQPMQNLIPFKGFDTTSNEKCFSEQLLLSNGFDKNSTYINFFIANQIHIDKSIKSKSQEAFILTSDHLASFIDDQGQIIDSSTVLCGWQHYFQQLAKVIKESTLIIIEAHSSPSHNDVQGLPAISNDIIRNFFHRYPIGAEAFIVLAASAGLFNKRCVNRYPRSAEYCRATLHRLQRRDYVIRYATKNDVEALAQLEQRCWQHTRTPKEKIYNRIQQYPQGQFVLEKNGLVLGVIYSQRIKELALLDGCNATNVHELHQCSAPIIQLLAINIDPGVQNLSLGDQLLEFMLQRCSLVSHVTHVAGVTLCKKFASENQISFDDYIKQEGSKQDPVLAFHQSHGAKIVKAISNYREEDLANEGNGVLVLYDIHQRVAVSECDMPTAKVMLGEKEAEHFIQTEIQQLLGNKRESFDLDCPLMEMGLDSADLLTLQMQLEKNYCQKFKPGFFFQFNSARKVIAYLEEISSPPPESCTATAEDNFNYSAPDQKTTLAKASQHDHVRPTDIAIIGMSCKLPGGIDCPDKLWQTLETEQSVIGSYPQTRGNWPAEADMPGISYGGFIEDADAFDASFFRISPAEAQVTDPQQRILLELAWGCIENANILPQQLKGSNTAVFIGASNCDYSRITQSSITKPQAHYATGSSLAVLANRISYFFDFSGPSLLIDTACSASFVTLHMAIQSLRSGECDSALVGGVNLICHPDLSIAYYKAGMLSHDGKCKVFDASANGYVRSEGAVMMLLKPLKKALSDGDSIKAVIKGSAVNHGGLAGGLTVPNPKKQSELLIAAWKNAAISPKDLSYIEAHGTGTSLGDPIEIQGMQMANAQLTTSERIKTCAIGSVKSNLGHLEAAAGITGLLKVILSFQNRKIPASINFSQLNSKIDFEDSPFYIASSLQAWNANKPRLAGVSSFGSGGSNAHIVIEEWIESLPLKTSSDAHLFVLSAKNRQSLLTYAESVLKWIVTASESASFSDFIYTFQTARTFMDERLAIKADDFSELKRIIQDWLATNEKTHMLWHNNIKHPTDESFSRQHEFDPEELANALAEKNLPLLASLWISGHPINFREMYKVPGTMTVVPTYPFARSRYWVTVASPKDEYLDHPFLGRQIGSSEISAFRKVWSSFPEKFLFRQNDFSCLSIGLVFEIFLSAWNECFASRKPTCLKDIRFYPFAITTFSNVNFETHYFIQGSELLVELFRLSGADRQLVACATVTCLKDSHDFIHADFIAEDIKAIPIEENGDSCYMPMETLKAIFPALVPATVSPVVIIPKVVLHNSSNIDRSLLTCVSTEKIGIFSLSRKPVITIYRMGLGV